VLLAPIRRRGRPIALLGLGPRKGGRPFGPDEQAFLRGVAACTAAPIENDLLQDELRRVRRHLSAKAFELLSLLDVSRDLAVDSAEESIQRFIVTSVMGHFVVSRCGLYLFGPRGLALAHGRGLKHASAPVPVDDARAALEGLAAPVPVAALAEPLRRRLQEARFVLAVPLVAGGPVEGILAVGERASGMAFSDEDREVALALARHALGALDAALGAQLVRASGEPDVYEFTHALIRHTLYADQSPSRQVRLHRRLAEELASRGLAFEPFADLRDVIDGLERLLAASA